jgi:hypothetical protein
MPVSVKRKSTARPINGLVMGTRRFGYSLAHSRVATSAIYPLTRYIPATSENVYAILHSLQPRVNEAGKRLHHGKATSLPYATLINKQAFRFL